MTAAAKENFRVIFRFTGRIIRKVSVILSTLLIITALTVFVLFIAGIRPYVVKTGSMEPALPVGCLCFVNENTPLNEISVGNVISFRMGNNAVVTHRVTAISGNKYTTKGDANDLDDSSPVTSQNYIGKIIFSIPKIGLIPVYLHTRKGLISTAALILILLILNFIPNKGNKSETQENNQDV